MTEETHRIDTPTFLFMLVIAFFIFDLPRLLTVIIPLAATIPAGAVGWIPLLGQIFSGWIIGGSNLMQTLVSIGLAIFGYATMGLWFACKGVQPLGGRNPTGRIATLLCTFLVSWIPIINWIFFFPLTVWVCKLWYDSRRDEKVDNAEAQGQYVEYNMDDVERNARRVRLPTRRFIRKKSY